MSREGRCPGARVAMVSPRQSTIRLQHRAASWRTPQTVEHHGARRWCLHLLRVKRSRLDVGYRAYRGAVYACDHHHPEARYLASETRKSSPFDVQRERSPATQCSLEQTRERNNYTVS